MATLEITWKTYPDGQHTATVVTPFGLIVEGTGSSQSFAVIDLIRSLSSEGYWVKFLPNNILTQIEVKMA